jgi:hypothetical protein
VIDSNVGRQAGWYLARYAKSHGLEIADALVAAAAVTAGYRLWTLNRKHYPMDDLRFFSPRPQVFEMRTNPDTLVIPWSWCCERSTR